MQVGVGLWHLFPLAALCDNFLGERRDLNVEMESAVDGSRPDGPWPRRWFPLFLGSAPTNAIVIQCPLGNANEYPSQLANAHIGLNEPGEGMAAPAAPRMPTLVSLLENWALWFDLGLIRWRPDLDLWDTDTNSLDVSTYAAAFGI